jgi:hypothetical protein
LIESRNPVGTGFGKPLRRDGDRLRLPNVENPGNLITAYGDVVEPWGFGFISPEWQPRAAFAGTYDEAWEHGRKPMLPTDFDRRFFNAAPSGLVAPTYLDGNEEVVALNVTDVSRLAFRLPGVASPRCRIAFHRGPDTVLETNLDTVIVNTDERQFTLLWRAYTIIPNGPHDVAAIAVAPLH